MKTFLRFIPAIILSLCLLTVWELIVRSDIISQRFLPTPSIITYELVTNWAVFCPHIIQTFIEALIGLVIAVILGITTAILLDISSWIKKAVYPLLIISQTIPMIALAPLLLLWFGFDLLPKVIIVVLSCFFPIAVATADGLAQTDPDFTKLLKSMNASYWQMLWLVRLPQAMPSFFSGLKIAATYSVTAAIVGEYVGAYLGLGIYMQEVAHSHVIALVFAAIAITAALSVLLVLAVVIIERIMLPWQHN